MSKRTYLFVSAEVNHMCHRILEKSDFCSHSLSSPEMNFALRTRIIVILRYHKGMSLSSKQTGYQVTTTFNTVRYKQYEVWSIIIGSVAIKKYTTQTNSAINLLRCRHLLKVHTLSSEISINGSFPGTHFLE